MKKSTEKMVKDMSFTIKVDVTKIPKFTQKGDYENYMNAIRCGNTVHKPKKGKGSYRRHSKYRDKYDY